MAFLNKRIVAKTLSWRLISTGITTVGVFILTGSLALAGALGVVDTIVKTFAYALHEKAWSKTRWGKPPRHRLDEEKIARDMRRQRQEAVDGYLGGYHIETSSGPFTRPGRPLTAEEYERIRRRSEKMVQGCASERQKEGEIDNEPTEGED